MRVLLLGAVPVCVLLTTIASAQSVVAKSADMERLPGRVVDVSVGEFYVRAPDSIPAGLTTFRLHQVGDLLTNREKVRVENLALATPDNDPTRAFHMLWIVRLENGKTVSEWFDAQTKGEPTPWAVDLGGPASADPPRTSNATLVLEPGTYALVCHVGSAREDKNRSHLLKGMFRPLTVVPSKSTTVSLPVPDVTARIVTGGAIQLSGPVRAGRQVIRVVNETTKSHEFILVRVKEGRAAGEVPVWKRQDGTPHPFEPRGGLSDIPPGATRVITAVFESGAYLFWTIRSPDRSVAVTVSGK